MFRALVDAFRAPIPVATRERLRDTWSALPPAARHPRQYLGRQYVGCGATIGAMPRCDFACRGCYLGEGANRIPPLPLEAIEEQIRELRGWLGEGGNLQLTDGEVSLRAPEDLVRLIRFARAQGLVPMLMTHGETFLRNPGALSTLVEEGGLTEVAIHIDSTQRGRRDPRFRRARSEGALMPLRDAFADLVRETRRRTGRALEAATTLTVTRANLPEVAEVVRWVRDNADAFKMVSFQPIAAVGRTEAAHAVPVSLETLWVEIARGLDLSSDQVVRNHAAFGHPACNRFLQGAVLKRDGAARFAPLLDADDTRDARLQRDLLAKLGGLSFRLDRRGVARARALGIALRAPRLVFRELPAWAMRWLHRVGGGSRARVFFDWARGDVRADYLNVVSHHFMAARELVTDEGRERLSMCTFRVARRGTMVPMCEVNAGGIRDAWYREWTQRAEETPDSSGG